MQDYVVRDYTIAFLERNFYRQYLERTRTKPDESLWSLWFGNNSMSWGFFITPVFRHGIWTNDVSEIRRAKFHYWTIGHVLSTGFVDPDAGENGGVFKFDDIDQFLGFYESVLRRVSNSQYEKAIFASYVKYIKQSKDPDQEPFLIPELRFAGKDTDHKHRLDFAVLNAHTMKFVGFELSPHSTHGAIKKAKEKTQKAINAEGAETWKNEMIKRNRYFAKYGITTVTFTDTDLEDMEACFECMLGTIESRGEPEPQLEDEVTAICQLSLDRPRE
jgi:hypothetical protein